MTYQPVLPSGGLVGFSFLTRTLNTQTAAFNNSAPIARDTAYFEANIGEVKTAEDLVSDRRLLRVALGAFGLSDDINSRAFVQQILEGGSEANDALANRLADDRYSDFAEAFGFGNPSGARTAEPGFTSDIISKFRAREFEVAVGNQDQSMRLALDAERSLPAIAALTGTEETRWLKIIGNPPLRKVFEAALGLPQSFGTIDLDKQVEVFRDRASRQLGISSLTELAEPEQRDALVQRFLIMDQVNSFSSQSSGSVALTLLQSMPRRF
ncbi:DUF1217 domain-containing protein [Roseovarius sp. LXJ103]|uniref:DUF1217 domain-containing protein n=1 Tax=Roseovarius carneus TaxID=2853164 RepID=UPI000D60E071|nr:DUF1217 domain-containing protein [Roseovarius carneus]MBZ8117531.1 DUF1217 domain-containing protein [Roseovarius carneus]PWE36673.1 flagellar protein [Pelagicola sp. LXJ1103]